MVEQDITIETRKITIPLGPFRLTFPEDPFVQKMLKLERRIYDATKINFTPEAKRTLSNTIKDGYFPVVYATHTSLYDGRPLAKAVNQILDIANDSLPPDQDFKGFVLPVATSIDTGHQDQTMRKYSENNLKLAMEEDRLFSVDFTRKKDQALYGLPANLLSFTRIMKKYIQARYGIAVFPEATVRGGRNKNKHLGKRIYGMQLFEEKTIMTMVRLVLREGATPVLIPVGIYGSYKVYSPDTYKPPTSTIARTLIPGMPRGLVKVKVGFPIKWDMMTAQIGPEDATVNEQSINDFLARKLSILVPQHARGVYRKTTQTKANP